MPTELQKMLAGQLYDAFDPELVRMRKRAHGLSRALNATAEDQEEERRRILTELIPSGGDTALVTPPFYCDYGSNIHLGKNCYFNFNCVILDICEVRVGDYCLFAPNVQIFTGTHPLNAELRRRQEYGKPVTIGSDVWVGGGAIILPGVTIGSRCVIGAGSVVTNNIPEGFLAVGNPCRVVRELED